MNAKRFFALLLSVLTVMTCLVGTLTVSADDADKFAPENEELVSLYEGEQGQALGSFGKGTSVAIKVEVESGKRLTQINYHALATYNSNVNQIRVDVYQWDTDYRTSVGGPVLARYEKINHVDNAPFDAIFPTNRNMTGELLIVTTYIDGEKEMTPWMFTGTPVEGIEYFSNGSACQPFCCNMTVADELTVTPATYTATFVAEGTEVGKVTFLEGDTVLFNIPEVPAKEGFYADWEAYTLNNADVTINAVYTDASGAIKPEIEDAAKMTGFAEDHKSFFRQTGSTSTVNRDGTISFVGAWAVDGDIDANITVNYMQMMKDHYVNWDGKGSIPNKSQKYNVIVLKVKAPAVCLDYTPSMSAVIGKNTDVYGIDVANSIKCDGTEEYWIFDFSSEKDFVSDSINSFSVNWAFSTGDETNVGAEFVLMGFQFFENLDAALAATGSEKATEAPETEAPETEAPETDAPATEAPEAPAETDAPAKKGGCGGVIGMGAVAVLTAAAAAVALKKKD